jgi:hypothetical protein
LCSRPRVKIRSHTCQMKDVRASQRRRSSAELQRRHMRALLGVSVNDCATIRRSPSCGFCILPLGERLRWCAALCVRPRKHSHDLSLPLRVRVVAELRRRHRVALIIHHTPAHKVKPLQALRPRLRRRGRGGSAGGGDGVKIAWVLGKDGRDVGVAVLPGCGSRGRGGREWQAQDAGGAKIVRAPAALEA